MDINRNLVIEKIHYEDLNSLGSIFEKTFGEEVCPATIRRRVQRMRQFYYFLRPLAKLSLWVKNLFNIYTIKIDGSVAGFLQVSYLNPKQLHLDYIAVSKKYRGQGLGSWALKQLIRKVEDTRNLTVVLEVRADNPAYYLYQRLGFSSQAGIVHYEKSFGKVGYALVPHTIPGLRRLRHSDRAEIYKLYRQCVPDRIQRVIRREYSDFNPSRFRRHLEWAKDQVMKNIKREYVVDVSGIIVASMEIYSYPEVSTHTINILLHPDFEELRASLMKYALFIVQKKYRYGLAGTTIYDDNIRKQQTLEKLGFNRKAVYYLMSRPPRAGEPQVGTTAELSLRPEKQYRKPAALPGRA